MRKVYFHSGAALLIGLFIYLFYRTEQTVVNDLAMRIFSTGGYSALRQHVTHLLPLNDFIIYSVPEGLWVFSVTLTSKAYYLKIGRLCLDGIMFPLIISIGLEILQLIQFTHGHFDFMDILASILGWAAARYLINYSPMKYNILQAPDAGRITCLANYAIVYLSYVMK